MVIEDIYSKALHLNFIEPEEAIKLYYESPLDELMLVANTIRKKIKNNDNIISWQIDRNINITNVCISGCKFCNFHVKPNSKDAFITTIDEYKRKIDELYALGGNQILLQGGCHPKLGLEFYIQLFSELKKNYPDLKLHALGPAEIVHLSKIENKSVKEILESLIKAGLDSLPGAGAEILSERVRKIISPAKCSAIMWENVMREAHKLNILTSATMMFGHIETIEERIEHLIRIRKIQNDRPFGSVGFKAFILWPFQDENTVLKLKHGISNSVTPGEYIRMIAISRIMLPNIENIQVSWLTMGKKVAQVCLFAGANDLGSIMIEENVVSKAGAKFKMKTNEIKQLITEAGFEPRLRNQNYDYLD
jgi:cyclic dehypoxanthinyl futalosine synthase